MKISFRFPAIAASDSTRARRRRSLLLAVVGIAVLPMAWRGPSCGQDFDFHLQNWLEMARAWHEGVVCPHWAASANYGAGEPRFVFYPPISRMAGALLGVVLPWSWTPLLFVLLAVLGAGLCFRAMAREWMSEDEATIGACLYIVHPYLLFVAYERGAMAELLSAMWMPLLVLFGLRKKPAMVPLALAVAAIWLTNAPAAVMGCYMLAAMVAVAAIQQKSWRLVRRAACAVPLGLGLAAFWLIPAIYEQRWVEIGRAIGPLMRVEDSFLFGYVGLAGVPPSEVFDTVYHNQILRMVSWIAVALIVASALAAWSSRRRRNALWMPFVGVGAAVAALQFRWSDLVWRLAPEMRYLQFPWRWMLVLGMIFAALAALALHPGKAGSAASGCAFGAADTRRAIAVRALAMLLIAGGMALLASQRFWQACDEEDNVAAQIVTFHGIGFEGTDEYTPANADNSAILQGLPQVRVLKDPGAEEGSGDEDSNWKPSADAEIPAGVRIERWHVERRTAVIASPGAGYVVLRLMDYPAWRVTRNGTEVQGRPQRSDGLMAIPVEAGTNRIEVRWRTTADGWAGWGITLAALAITLTCGRKGWRKFDDESFR